MKLSSESYPISNSTIQSFLRCRRKWWLGYYRGLTPRVEKAVGPLAIGTRVHIALSAYYSTEHRDAIAAYDETVRQDKERCPELVADIEKESALGRVMLEGYFAWIAETGIDQGLTVISDEERIEVASGYPGVLLIGKLDVRVRREEDNARLFIDHKTVGSLLVPTLPMDPQMLMYHLLEFLKLLSDTGAQADLETSLPLAHERCDGGLYNMLKKSKRTTRATPPFYDRIHVQHNIHELRSFWVRLHGTIRDILEVKDALDAGADHHFVAYPSPRSTCSWDCPFFAICGLADDGSHFEGAIELSYRVADPYRYYDESVVESDVSDD